MFGISMLYCTIQDQTEAERIGGALVEEGFAACVNIFPVGTSIYRWEGSLIKTSEVVLLVKTSKAKWESCRTRIEEMHSYETPCILVLPVTQGSERFMKWVNDQA